MAEDVDAEGVPIVMLGSRTVTVTGMECDGNPELDPVTVTVDVPPRLLLTANLTNCVVTLELRITLDTLKDADRPEEGTALRVTVPANPFNALIVRVVFPVIPEAKPPIVLGLADIEKSLGPITRKVTTAVRFGKPAEIPTTFNVKLPANVALAVSLT